MEILKRLNDDLFQSMKKEIIFGFLQIFYGFMLIPITLFLIISDTHNSNYIYLSAVVFWAYILGFLIILGFLKKYVAYAYYFFSLKKKYLDSLEKFKSKKAYKIVFVLLIICWIYFFIKLLSNNFQL